MVSAEPAAHPRDLSAPLEVDIGARLLGVGRARQHHVRPDGAAVAMVALQRRSKTMRGGSNKDTAGRQHHVRPDGAPAAMVALQGAKREILRMRNDRSVLHVDAAVTLAMHPSFSTAVSYGCSCAISAAVSSIGTVCRQAIARGLAIAGSC